MFYFRVSMNIDARGETLSQTFCFIIGYPPVRYWYYVIRFGLFELLRNISVTLLVLRNRVNWINYWLRPISCSSDNLNLPNGEIISYLPRSNFVPNFMVFYIDCAIIIIVLLYITYPLLCMYRVSISFQP